MPYDYDAAAKGIIDNIKSWSRINQEKAKIMGNIALQKVKHNQEMELYKQKQEYMNPFQRMMYDQQKELQSQYEGQQGNTQPIGGVVSQGSGQTQGQEQQSTSVFDEAVPENKIILTSEGYKRVDIDPQEYYFQKIQEKKQRGIPLNEDEVRFEREQVGLKSETEQKGAPKKWDVEKEARLRITSMVNNNPEVQEQVWEDPKRMFSLIDNEVERLSEIYGLTDEEKQGVKDSLKKEVEKKEDLVTGYSDMTEDDLFKKVQSGDVEARKEAIKRGYIKE